MDENRRVLNLVRFLFMVFGFQVGISQQQIGLDIDGEAAYNYSGSSRYRKD